jgi:hypothetical protein
MRPRRPFSSANAMNSLESIPVLDRLFSLLCRSLPAYLADVKTLGWYEDERIHVAINRLVGDQRMYAQRVSEAITENGGRPEPARFPTEFAAKNDLSLRFLLQEIVDSQRDNVGSIEQCVGRLEGDSALHALAEEILGNAKGHLDILRALLRDKR